MDNDLLANSITKGLAYTENGGSLDISNPKKGMTGETKSIFQFEPPTWKRYSREAFGRDNVPMNSDTETYVVQNKVKNWIKKGYKARQIASMWNAGEQEPDAYTGKFSDGSSSTGVNKKYGVKFDVPGYADKVLQYSKKFYEEKSGQKPVSTSEQSKPLASILNLIQQAKSKTPSPSSDAISTSQTSTQPVTQGLGGLNLS